MKSIQGKRALLTGASRGIGIHIAQALAAQGVHLVLTARDESNLLSVKENLKQYDISIETIVSDMADQASLKNLFDQATQDEQPIDLLINNAGIYAYSNYDETDFCDIEKMIQVNLSGLMYITRLVLPGMKSRGHGHIVNMSSLAGLSGSAYAEAYCATKHAVVGFTRAMRASLKQNRSLVSTSVICPGVVGETGIFDKLSRDENITAPALMGESNPRDVASAVVRSIIRDLPEVVVNPRPVRPGLALASLFPRIMEWATLKLGLHGFLPPGQN